MDLPINWCSIVLGVVHGKPHAGCAVACIQCCPVLATVTASAAATVCHLLPSAYLAMP